MANLNKTKVFQSFNNWCAETYKEVNGQAFKISTSKGYNGKINSSSQPCEISEDGSVLFKDMLNLEGKNLTLLTVKARATEKTISEQHANALVIFDEKIQEVQPVKEDTPVIGSIIFLDGYEKSKGSQNNKHVVYEIEKGRFGINYKTVELDSLLLSNQDHVRTFSKKFGIGMYFEPSYKFEGTPEELKAIVLKAQNKAIDDTKQKEAAQAEAAQIRAKKIEQGKSLVNIPEGTKAVILADLMQDESDIQSDYFHSSSSKKLYLAFSTHTRDLFNEMRKAALNCDVQEVRILAEAPATNSNGETREEYFNGMLEYFKNKPNAQELATKETASFWNPSDEHREKYSMGAGFYLKTSRSRNGWQISKSRIDITNEAQKESLYIAAAEGRYFIPTEEEKAEVKTAPNYEKIDVEEGKVQVIEYSEKAIAIIGDTRPIKEQLKSIGARFNPRLSCGAGWILAKTKQSELTAIFN